MSRMTHAVFTKDKTKIRRVLLEIKRQEKAIKEARAKTLKKSKVSPREIGNIEKLAGMDLVPVIPNIPHVDRRGRYISGGLPYLTRIHEEGRGQNPQRPFLSSFKAKVRVKLPKLTQGFSAVKKDIEDQVRSEFIQTMRTNKLKLEPLSYRDGVPLWDKGDMVRAIQWKLVATKDSK